MSTNQYSSENLDEDDYDNRLESMESMTTAFETEVTVGDTEFRPTEITVNLRARGAQSKASVSGVPVNGPIPALGNEVKIKVGGPGTTSDGEMTTIFKGIVNNADLVVDQVDAVSFEAHHTTFQHLAATPIDETFDNATPTSIISSVCDTAGVRYNISLPSSQCMMMDINDQTGNVYALDIVQKVIERTGNGMYYFSADDKLICRDTTNFEPRVNKLELMTDMSGGADLPPFNSVRVIGSSPSPREGSSARHLLTRSPPIGTAGDGKPVFTIRDSSIHTTEEANAVARTTLENIKYMQAQNEITVVGWADILPMSFAYMPPHRNAQRAEKTWIVNQVQHKLNSSDGYVTTMKMGMPIEAKPPRSYEEFREEGEEKTSSDDGGWIENAIDEATDLPLIFF